MDKGNKSEISVLSSIDQTFISEEEKTGCFASIFSDKSTFMKSKIARHITRTDSNMALESKKAA